MSVCQFVGLYLSHALPLIWVFKRDCVLCPLIFLTFLCVKLLVVPAAASKAATEVNAVEITATSPTFTALVTDLARAKLAKELTHRAHTLPELPHKPAVNTRTWHVFRNEQRNGCAVPSRTNQTARGGGGGTVSV